MKGNNGPSRYGFIDAVRGIAASLVMLEHALEAGGLQEIAKGKFGLSWLNIGETGVVAFFFVSGFVIPLSLEKWNDVPHFWINRVFRIYPLYLTVYFITAALMLFDRLPLSGMPLNFLAHLLFVQEFVNTPNFVGVAWTLALEAVWYLIFTLLFAFSLNKKLFAIVGLALIAILTASTISLVDVARLPMGRVSLLVVCMFGLLCLRRERGEVSGGSFSWAAATLAAAIFFGLFVGFYLRPSSSPITPAFRCVAISWLFGAAVFLIPFFFRTWSVTNNAITRYLGKISYSIYLLHPVVMLLVSRTGIHGLPYVVLVMVSTIAVSGFTYRYIEYPAISISHALRPSKALVAQ